MRTFLKNVYLLCVYLFVLLLVYAAVSKLADFQNFKIQLAQSPLLTAYASFTAHSVLAAELFIAVLLCFTTGRKTGLYLFLALMSAFSVYVYLILYHSPFIPCSCGGILEKMGWKEHLVFNMVCCLLALFCILYADTGRPLKKPVFLSVFASACGLLLIFGLHRESEHIIKKENPFVRKFLPHPVTDLKGVKLPYNSYYVAGYSKEHFYLGNATAPRHGLVLNSVPEITDTVTLNTDRVQDAAFSAVNWNIVNDSLLLNDSSEGTFYTGMIHEGPFHKKETITANSYSSIVPLTSNVYALRTFNQKQNNVTLGLFNTASGKQFTQEALLYEERQPQDLFSNDGILLFNRHLNKIIYVFYYKNKSFVFDSDLTNRQVLQTIDTITTPNFKMEYLKQKQQLKISEKAIVVNKAAATAGNYLFIISERMGKNERRQMYARANIIDVYNIADHVYEYSFYLHHFQDTPITELRVFGNYIIGLGGNYFSLARFKKSIYD